jgi:hypothetical protein
MILQNHKSDSAQGIVRNADLVRHIREYLQLTSS